MKAVLMFITDYVYRFAYATPKLECRYDSHIQYIIRMHLWICLSFSVTVFLATFNVKKVELLCHKIYDPTRMFSTTHKALLVRNSNILQQYTVRALVQWYFYGAIYSNMCNVICGLVCMIH